MTSLNFRFRPRAVHGRYGINYYFQKKGEKEQRLQFESTLIYCGQYMDEYAIFHISKEEFVVNRNESDEYLYDIAKKCAKVIYPITILVDNNGKIAFIRTDDVGKDWVKAREKLECYYKGEVTEKYLDNVERLLNSKMELKQLVTKDLFFCRLFSVVYKGAAMECPFEEEIALIPFKNPLVFSSMQKIELDSINDDESETIRIVHKGQTNTLYKYGMLYNAPGMNSVRYNAPISAMYELSYRLAKGSLDIKSIEGDFLIKVDSKELSTVKIRAYRLDEKPVEFGKDEEFAKAERKQR